MPSAARVIGLNAEEAQSLSSRDIHLLQLLVGTLGEAGAGGLIKLFLAHSESTLA